MKAKEVIRQIEDKLKNLSEEDLRNMLNSIGSLSFMRYSALNQLAIIVATDFQNPGYVTGYKTWEKYGRAVKKGEHGIPILAPIKIKRKNDEDEDKLFFKTVYVFAEKQVKVVDPSKKLPRPPIVEGTPTELYEEIKSKIEKKAPIIEKPLYGALNGQTDGVTIYIREDLPVAHKLKTLAHEYTHMKRKLTKTETKDRQKEEMIAETSAFTFMQMHGIDTSMYSISYIKSWSQGKEGKEIRKTLLQGISIGEKIYKELNEEKQLAAAA